MQSLERRVLFHTFTEGADGIARVVTENTDQSIHVEMTSTGRYLVTINDIVTPSSSTFHASKSFDHDIAGIVIDARGGNDGIFVDSVVHVAVTLRGGSGDDSLTSLVGGVLEGGDGNDRLGAEGSAATLDGGAGDDTVNGNTANPFATAIIGGAGNDLLDYSFRAARLHISLDGLANDGAAGEGDNVGSDIETILGGSNRDVIVGDDGPNVFLGNGGRDVLVGMGGNDTLSGGNKNDVLIGGLGADQLIGSAGLSDTVDYSERTAPLTLTLDGQSNDGEGSEGDTISPTIENLIGGIGGDFLLGSGRANGLFGGPGNDTIFAGSGNDTIDGGAGTDEIAGHSGNDTLLILDGVSDTVSGGSGTDLLDESDPSDVLEAIP